MRIGIIVEPFTFVKVYHMQAQPIIPWMGGKRRLADILLPRFPVHHTYVELFAGGAALYFMRHIPAKVEVINDVNGDVVNLYRVVQNHLEEFVRQFKYALSSRQIFEWLKETPSHTLTDIQRAARFFYLQQHCFGGKVDGQSWGFAPSAPPVNLLRIEEKLSAAHLRLAAAYIENDDWHKVFKRYDRPDTLFYFDPPYWETEGYGVNFAWDEYVKIAEAMRTMQGKGIVSHKDHPAIRELFADFDIEEVPFEYSLPSGDKTQKVTELIIYSWDRADEPTGLF